MNSGHFPQSARRTGGVLAIALALGVLRAGAQERCVTVPSRLVPVIDRVDVVVVGGSEGGMAAAWKAAKLGAKVLLLNDENFLGSEVAGKGNFAFEGRAQATNGFAGLLFASLSPDKYPVVCNRLLREVGVVVIGNTRPCGVVVGRDGKLCGVTTANKGGVQAVVAKTVIDATPAGIVADQAGARRQPWPGNALEVRRWRFSEDRKKKELVVKEAEMPRVTWPLLNRAETSLRESWHYTVSGGFAYSMDFVMPNAVVCKASVAGETFQGAGALDLGVCEPAGVERLLLIGSSCALSRAAVKTLMAPGVLAEVGERLGERAVRIAVSVTLPDEIAVKGSVRCGVPVPGLALREMAGMERPYRRLAPEMLVRPEACVPVWGEYDVVVVGSGPSGHSAAIAAGRAGAKTLLVEQAGFIGGNAAMGIKAFWGGYRKGFNQEWWTSGANYPKMLSDAGVDVWYHSQAMGAVKRGDSVAGVEVATWLGCGVALGKVVIDASGEGDVCAAAGADTFYVNDGDLCLEESSFMGQNLYTNCLPADPVDVAGFTLNHALAGQYAGRQGFPMSQIRETRRIRGDYVVDELDVDVGRTYRDVISIAHSAFDPHGYYCSDYSFGGLMPPTRKQKFVDVQIPLRAILPAALENILVVGRCHSMTHDVQALVRMNADVINEGYAAGYIAALCAKNGTTPRRVDLRPVQGHLASIGNLPEKTLSRIAVDLPAPTDQEIGEACQDPASREHLLVLARGGSRSVAPLRVAFEAEPSLAKAKALCLLGDAAGVPLLAEWVEKMPLGQGPAYDCYGFMEVPEIDGAVWLLAIPKDRRAVSALVAKLRECRADTGFNKIRAVTLALGRIGDPQAARPLAEFLGQQGVRGHMDTGKDASSIYASQFSRSMLELFAASALYRCGDCDGLGHLILTDYLDDWRGIFVRFAGHTLEEKQTCKQ